MASESPNLAALPTPQSVTLLLKNNMSTTLLSVEQTSTFDEIKVLLIAALRSRNAPGIPESPTSLELGVLADRRDHSKGWVTMDVRVREVAAGKNAKKTSSGKKSGSNNNVEAAGLVDGSWVAWRIKNNPAGNSRGQKDADNDTLVVDYEDDEEVPGWDVVIPAYEDEEEE